MGYIADQVLARAQEDGKVRYGFIESLSGGLAAVRMGGTTIEGATWVERYSPIVGDRVAVIAGAAGWLVLGAVADRPKVHKADETIFLPIAWDRREDPDGGVWGRVCETVPIGWPLTDASWDDDLRTPEIDGRLPVTVQNPVWTYAPIRLPGIPVGYVEDLDEINVPDYLYNFHGSEAILVPIIMVNYFDPYWGRFNPLPSNAEVTSMRLIARMGTNYNGRSLRDTQEVTVAPYVPDPNAPYNPDPADMTDPALGRVGLTGRPGDVISTPLPPTWVDALLANEAQGFVIDSDRTSFAYFEGKMEGDLQTPRISVADNTFELAVTYSVPEEEDQ